MTKSENSSIPWSKVGEQRTNRQALVMIEGSKEGQVTLSLGIDRQFRLMPGILRDFDSSYAQGVTRLPDSSRIGRRFGCTRYWQIRAYFRHR